MKKIIRFLFLSTILINTGSAFADEGFPINFLSEIKEKTMGVSLFYSDGFTLDNKVGTPELRAEIKANFLEKGTGVISEIAFQNMFSTNPSIISGLVPAGDAYSQDASALIGYQFSFFDSVALSPYIKGRAIVTRGRGGDNFYGSELGTGFEWKIYPESTFLNVKYGLMVPIVHRYTGDSDVVAPYSFLLNNFEARLRYRFLPDYEVMTAYHLRQFPKQLGKSGLTDSSTFLWGGILIGIGYVF